jgi:8-oxo-dGTP diphosphatase
MSKKPKVGVAAIIRNNNQILLGKRLGSHGSGCWAYPGGHLEYMETLEECARRETREEVGLEISNIQFGVITNDLFNQEQEHYITIGMIADYQSGEPKILEPAKCEQWEWFAWNDLPTPLFLPLVNQLQIGFNPFSQ